MWRPEGPRRHQSLTSVDPRDAVNAGDLQALLGGHGWQNRGERAGQQCLATPRRPLHQKVVPTCGRHFQRASGSVLPAHQRQVHLGSPLSTARRGHRWLLTLGVGQRSQEHTQVGYRDDLDSRHGRRLVGGLGGHEQGRMAQPGGRQGSADRSGHGTDATVQAELAEEHAPGDLDFGQQVHVPQHGDCQRQVVAGSPLGEVSGREVGDQTRLGKLQTEG